MASDTLILANNRLKERQAQARQRRIEAGQSAVLGQVGAEAASAVVASWLIHNGRQALAAARRRAGLVAPGRVRPAPERPTPAVKPEPKSAGPVATLRVYPDIGLAALAAGQAAVYRVWLMCRHLDAAGQGWLEPAHIREQLAGEGSRWRLFSWRRLRQVLAEGNGRFWTRDEENGRLWLHGAAKVAAALDVARLTGRPVALPVVHITAGIGEFKAHLYAAWHSGRKVETPISRACQQRITGIPERTQRHYCQAAGIERVTNIAIGPRHTAEAAQEQAWRHGRAAFTFIDVQGRQGERNGRYVAWQLPTSHKARHAQAARGRQKKINRNLVTNGARGNSVDRLFFAEAGRAGKAYSRDGGVDRYWRGGAVGGTGRFSLWYVLPVQPGRKKVAAIKGVYCISSEKTLTWVSNLPKIGRSGPLLVKCSRGDLMSDKALVPVEQREVEFYGDELTAVRAEDGQIYVSIRHLCQALSLNTQAQTRRIQRHHVMSDGYTWVAIMATQQRRRMYMLRVDLVPFWLSTLETRRVSEDVRPKLERFQREAAKILWEAFQEGRLTTDPVFDELLQQDTPEVQAYKMIQGMLHLARNQIIMRSQLQDHEQQLTAYGQRLEQIETQLGDSERHITPAQATEVSQAVKAVAMALSKQSKRNEYGGVYGELYRRFEIPSYKQLPANRFQETMDWLGDWLHTITGEGF